MREVGTSPTSRTPRGRMRLQVLFTAGCIECLAMRVPARRVRPDYPRSGTAETAWASIATWLLGTRSTRYLT